MAHRHPNAMKEALTPSDTQKPNEPDSGERVSAEWLADQLQWYGTHAPRTRRHLALTELQSLRAEQGTPLYPPAFQKLFRTMADNQVKDMHRILVDAGWTPPTQGDHVTGASKKVGDVQ